MAVTFNGPLKISRPGYTVDGVTPNNTNVPNRQAWSFPVQSSLSALITGNGASQTLTVGVLPAGSQILDMYVNGFSTVAAGGGPINVTLGGNIIAILNSPAITANSGFEYYGNPSSAAAVQTWWNTGTTDQILTFGPEGYPAGLTGIFVVEFVVRNTDGSLSDEGYRPFTQ